LKSEEAEASPEPKLPKPVAVVEKFWSLNPESGASKPSAGSANPPNPESAAAPNPESAAAPNPESAELNPSNPVEVEAIGSAGREKVEVGMV
jgi:hypothetical protein